MGGPLRIADPMARVGDNVDILVSGVGPQSGRIVDVHRAGPEGGTDLRRRDPSRERSMCSPESRYSD